MRGLTNLEIAVELITWRARLEKGVIRLPRGKSQWLDDFADYLLYRDRRRHLHDLQGSVQYFAASHATLSDWYRAVLKTGEIKVSFLQGRPRIAIDSFHAWRMATARLDHDALLTYALLDQVPDTLEPGRILESLRGWGVFPTAQDNDLERILRRGVADTHVHFEASDPIPLLWARLMHGHDRIEAIPRYSHRDMQAIVNNPERLERRRFERRIVEQAVQCRKDLIDRVKMHVASPAQGAAGTTYLLNERYFLLTVWRQVREDFFSDEELRLWDTYLFAKNLFHSEQQQFSGSGAGLSRFRQYLDRGESLTEARAEKRCKRARLERMRRLVDFATEPSDLQHIELRIAPKKHVRDYFTAFSLWEKLLNDYPDLKRRCAEGRLRIGFVVHFIRKPEETKDGPLFSGLRRLLDRHSAVLHLFRLQHWDLARHIVGIDVANMERGCPPEIFSPFLRQLRGQDILSEKGMIRLEHWERLRERGAHRHPLELPVLGQTYHVGEDYYHIVDGLRHMDCVGRFLLESGDRLGHGLAIGADAKGAAGKRGAPLHIMNGILLDNLVWLYHRGQSFGCLDHAATIKVENAICRLSELIYDTPVDIPLLSGLQKRRYGLPPASIGAATSREDRLFASHLYDPGVRGRRHDWADAERANILDDLHEVTTCLQDAVVRDLRARGIVIEANPTSNLATGAVGSMEEHPLLRHLRCDHDAGLFSINTDDPGVFATRIENEYALLFSAMLKQMDRPTAISIIDHLRQTGMESSFLHRMESVPSR
ncbi:hypothetical protein CRT60_05385 [Azospirillum palustre]|uniref:adenosine deaminase n=1 Tax=Azospirillum palustre TaxID=2044885 RepID=A0A2B8BLF7_9PROT|nr:hypothetical protein [Azospirillum palustre]PGH58580.1 hypothetical protein CRT60_05385 [Azospirillum palustre]